MPLTAGRPPIRFSDIRNRKYPPTMKCAGSIFKNFLLAELPPRVAERNPAESDYRRQSSLRVVSRTGGRERHAQAGDIHVADYHANLIYNSGCGTARDLAARHRGTEAARRAAVGHSARRRGPIRRIRRRARRS